MAIEDTLSSIDTTLKAILVALTTAASVTTVLGEPETKAGKATSKKSDTKANAKPTSDEAGAVLEGHEAGTKYWMSGDLRDFYVTKPGEGQPPGDGIKNVSAAFFAEHKNAADAQKKSNDAAAAQKAADTAPTATAGQGAASTTSTVTFKTVTERLQEMSKTPEPKGGREAIKRILAIFLPDVAEETRRVPTLEGLNKNAEILAAVNAALADDVAAPAGEVDLF